MKIRKYKPTDAKETMQLFYDTVHLVNCRDYNEKQLDVWAPKNRDENVWNASFLPHYSLVVVENTTIIGFGDIDESGYLDRFYIHASYQNQGVGKFLLKALEDYVSKDKTITTHASITAKPFFEKMGYVMVKEQTVVRSGVELTNYVMEKRYR